MSDAAAREALRRLDVLCAALETLPQGAQQTCLHLALRALAHPALAPYHADPLLPLDDRFPSLDAREQAIRQLLARHAPSPEGEIGGIWGALYLSAEGRAVPVRLQAVTVPATTQQASQLRQLGPELSLSALAALRAACAVAEVSHPVEALYDITVEGMDDSQLAAVAGDSLGLPLALAFLSALLQKPLARNLAATGAIGRASPLEISEVGWVAEKRQALSSIPARLLEPGIPSLKEAAHLAHLLATPGNATASLPEELTTLIGREKEMQELTLLLRDPSVRLLTLTGPGGVGKTRLAREVARQNQTLFLGGIHAATLEEALSDAERERVIVEAFETRSTGAAGRRLIVLDNFDAALDHATTVARLLRSSSETCCLVTSRAALSIRGERRIVIDGLAIESAIALFRSRAQEAGVAPPREQAALRRICRRLGGLPLAIELAAARLRHLTLADLEERLGDALDLLATRSPDTPERQRTMRATLEWSVGLLNESEQRLLRALSVFEGGFSASSASAVLGEDALDAIARLEEVSLLRPEQTGTSTTRLRLQPLVQEYARELSEAAREHGRWQEAHARHFRQRALDAWEIGPDIIARYNDLDADRENLRALFRRSDPIPTDALAALTRYLRRRGRWTELEDWLLLARTRSRTPAGMREAARLLMARETLERHRGRLSRAARCAHHARRLALAIPDPLLAAEAQMVAALGRARTGEPASAAAELNAALTVFEAHRDELGCVAARGNRAVLSLRAHDWEAARTDLTALVTLARRLGSRPDELRAVLNLSLVEWHRKDYDSAARYAWEALELSEDDPHYATQALLNLGRAYLPTRPDAARRLLHGAQTLHERHPLTAEALGELQAALDALPPGENPPLATHDELTDIAHWRRLLGQ